jgi:hypothetical protein
LPDLSHLGAMRSPRRMMGRTILNQARWMQ